MTADNTYSAASSYVDRISNNGSQNPLFASNGAVNSACPKGKMTTKVDSTILSTSTSPTMSLSDLSSKQFLSSPPSSASHHSCTKKMLKLTILSVNGIRISTNAESLDYHEHHYLAITASVSFAGSSDHMRVRSSGFCSVSQRVLVESNPLVVTMESIDSLTATWDDSSKLLASSSTGYHRQDESTDMSKLTLPHLYVSIPNNDNSRSNDDKHESSNQIQINHDSLLNTPTKDQQYVTHVVPPNQCHYCNEPQEQKEGDDDNIESSYFFCSRSEADHVVSQYHKSLLEESGSSFSYNNDEIKNLQMDKNKNHLTRGTTKEGPSNTLRHHHHLVDLSVDAIDTDDVLVNSFDEATLETPVPEILEFNISLKVQRILSNHENVTHNDCNYSYDKDPRIHVKSSCSPTSEKGDAIAHLVLYPDIIRSTKSSSSSMKGTYERIIELPLRRRVIPFSKSGGDGRGSDECMRLPSIHKNLYAWIDLDEDAIMTVKLEECTEEDETVFENCKRSTLSGHDQFLNPIVLSDSSPIKQKSNVDWKVDYSAVGNLGIASSSNANHNTFVNQMSVDNTSGGSDTVDNEVLNFYKMICDALMVENVLNICSGRAGILRCRDDDTNSNNHAADFSMDSSIQSFFHY